MPILQPDPWRQSFFQGSECPHETIIPIKDPEAYRLNPLHSWVYNKLIVAERQGLRCAPHGVEPDQYPVFSKPIYNLKSMGAESGVIRNRAEYLKSYAAGSMWCEILSGEHLSTDMAVIGGHVVWFAHTIGYPLAEGTFDYWEILPRATERKSVEDYLSAFIKEHLAGYTGMMNFETMGGKIIEVHLRFADQWTDLYGKSFIDNLIKLYAQNQWQLDPLDRSAYSVVLFGKHKQYSKPCSIQAEAIIDGNNITSIQFPFHEDICFSQHSMPPGGFRLAIVNGYSLEACQRVREQLQKAFQ